MPPTPTERQKLLIQQEIAKLSGAISRHNPSYPPSYHPYGGYSRGARGGFRGRGAYRGRGRGRGGSTTLDLRANRGGASSTTAPSADKEDGEVSPPTEAGPSRPTSSNAEWVKRTSKGGNMSLMTVQRSEQLKALPPKPRQPKLPPQVQMLQSTAESTPGGTEAKRVVVDGVVFQFDEGGKKLTRIGELPSAAGSSSAAGTPTRQSLNYGGERYRRTKRGNLISRTTLSAKRAEQAKKPCRYYTKTGRCERALTCPYQHIPDRLAICPRFLRGSCGHTLETCPLSHSPSAHNTPTCVHFQATSTCRNGSACLYPHVRVTEDAPVCEAFAREGWCDREPGTCPELHIWECPEWHAKGTCARGAKCGLRHVLRAEKDKTAAPVPATTGAAPGCFDDQSDFIGLPGDVFSDSETEEDEDENEEMEESSDDESVQGKMSSSSLIMYDDDDEDEAQVLGEV